MLHRGIKFAHAIALVFATMLAFLVVQGVDEKWPLGHSALVWVNNSDNAVSGEQVTQMVESFAAAHHVTVAREIPDLSSPDSRRRLYLTSGKRYGAAASWPQNGYPDFSKDFRTTVRPLTEISDRDPRGRYFVYGSPQAADRLLREFMALGLHGEVSHPLAIAALFPLYLGSPLFWTFVVAALAVAALTGASVLLSARSYGVARLQGRSYAEVMFRDVQRLIAFWVSAGAITAILVLAFLTSYNGLAQLRIFGLLAVGTAGVLLLQALVVHAAVLALTFNTEILPSLKGELPSRAASLCTFVVRVPALLLALSAATAVVTTSQDVAARQDSRAAYAEAGNATFILLNGSLGRDSTEMETRVGQWLHEADADGHLILAVHRELRDVAPRGLQLPQGEVLIVNETFLTRQKFLDPTGQRYLPDPRSGGTRGTGEVRLIVPQSLKRHAATISAGVPDLLNAVTPDVVRRAGVETLWAKNDQRIFSYNTGKNTYSAASVAGSDRSFVDDPVLVVIPNGAKFVRNDDYTAYAAQEGVVFPNPEHILRSVRENGLQTYLAAIRPVGENHAQELKNVLYNLRLQILNFGMSLAVLFIAGVGICFIFARKHSQKIFVRHISGWRFLATHRSILVFEVLTVALLLSWIPLHTWLQNRNLKKFTDLGIPPPREPVQMTSLDIGITSGLVALGAISVIATLAFFYRQIVREGSAAA